MKFLNAAPKIKLQDLEVLKLWVRAGGRCEFHGCNKYLLEDEFTGISVKLADVAHIIGRSQKGPRGKNRLPVNERNKAENLILLCSEHHNKIIDKKELLDQFSKEHLIKQKCDHENRIKYLTGLGCEHETVVIRLIGNIRGDSVSVSKEEIRRAVLGSCRYPRYLGAENNIEINLANLPQKNSKLYWQSGKDKIEEIISRQIFPAIDKNEVMHLSIFALARIPFLIYFGHCLGCKIQTDIYQKHRHGDEGWTWKKEGEEVNFESIKIQKGNNESKVAIILSISGKINLSQLPKKIDKKYTVYEIIPVKIKPNRDILCLKNTLDNFRNIYQNLLRKIESAHKTAEKIHIFPAVPISAAIICGREIMKEVTPTIFIYDKAIHGYDFATEVK